MKATKFPHNSELSGNSVIEGCRSAINKNRMFDGIFSFGGLLINCLKRLLNEFVTIFIIFLLFNNELYPSIRPFISTPGEILAVLSLKSCVKKLLLIVDKDENINEKIQG